MNNQDIIDNRILRQTKSRVARCLFEAGAYSNSGTYDRFIPSRANNTWETSFALSIDSNKNSGSKKVRENGDNTRDNSVYGCLLKNEILGDDIEDVKTQCEDRQALTPVKNLYKYGTPSKKVIFKKKIKFVFRKKYSYGAIRFSKRLIFDC